jgi:uncharacterized protein involved in exopolysaccharide biosynthesis
MPSTEDRTADERIAYILTRWRFLLSTVVAAGLLSLGVSELLPRRYTATATLIIDPPGSNDPRTAMVVNPTYLDSLRTFERFFTSDTLFAQAAEKFHLQAGGIGIPALRKRILKVGVQRDTRVLEVSATLRSPKDAIALVQYITERSLGASREEAEATDRETLKNVSEELERAQVRFEKAQAEWELVAQQGTPQPLEQEVGAAVGLQSEVRRLETEANAAAAEFRARLHDGDETNQRSNSEDAISIAAGAAEYAKREQELAAEISSGRKLLAEVTQRHAVASGELDAARKAYEAALSRQRDFSALSGLRSEHMRVIDPGVEPRQPSSPDVLSNTIGASLLAACMALAWLGFAAGMPRRKPTLVHTALAAYEDRSISAG